MSGETDRLINLTKSFSKSPNPVDFDNAISTGENLSCALMSIYLNNQKTKSKSLHSWQIPIMTSSEHMKSRILSINKKFLLNELENLDVLVVPGFQGINERREITTLGRGGSDTSAVAVAAAMDAAAAHVGLHPARMPCTHRDIVCRQLHRQRTCQIGGRRL